MYDVAGHARDRNYMPMILLDHSREKLSDHPEVRNSVDLENLLNHFFPAPEYGLASADPSIVYQNCWFSMIPSNLRSNRSNCCRVCNVGFVEKDAGC